MIINVLILVIVSMLSGCSKKQQEFNPEFNKEGKPLEITLVVHDNRRTLIKEYNEWVGRQHAINFTERKMGWATWNKDSCTIHIDKTLTVNDYIETLGHEYAHCLYGRYHQ